MNLRLHIGNLFWCFVRRFPLRMLLCDLSLSEIPASTRFPHPIGIVVKTGTRIGENVTISQNTTIGGRYPNSPPITIGDNVLICADALILGGVTIGSGAVIGAGAIVLMDIPAGSTYVCRIIPRFLKW